MSDLDIQIDVPDDDDLDSSVRVLSGDSIPPWLKAAAVLILGGLAALTIGAFLLGRTRDAEDPVVTPTVLTTPIASAAASPVIESSLQAVETWEAFAKTGDLAGLEESFDPAGPQFETFRTAPFDGSSDIDFAARNLSETTAGGITTVSMDLVVSSATGQETYPFDMVYLGDSTRVWTVIDRRDPGSVTLPPDPETIAAARESWSQFVGAMSDDDWAGVSAVVTTESRLLADQIAAAAAGFAVDDPVLQDRELFDLLVARVQRASVDDPGQVLVALLDADQRRILFAGELGSWAQLGPERVVATLVVDGESVATVPFVASAEGWAFDLQGALESSEGRSQ